MLNIMDDKIKVQTVSGQIRYIDGIRTKNGLNRVFDEFGRSITVCIMEQALKAGIYQIID